MVTDASFTATVPTLTLPRAQLAAQIRALGLPRNTLNALFDLPESGAAPPSWQGLGQQEQAALQLVLPLLASPGLVARTRAVLGEERMLATWIVTGSGNDPALMPYLLLAHNEGTDSFQMKPVRNRDTVARSLLPYLDTGLPASAGDAFELPAEAFVLLVALTDLVRRARFSAGLDHAPSPQQFTVKDLEMALADGQQHADPRWLLPHLLAIRPDLSSVADVGRWLPVLKRHGWLANAASGVSLSESGQRLAHYLDQRLAMLSFWVVGATPRGELASRSALFVRSPWHIWCFDVGGDDGTTAIGAPVDVATTYGLLQDLLTPVGVPLLVSAPAQVQPGKPRRKATPEPIQQSVPSRTPGKGATARRPASPQLPPLQLAFREGVLAGRAFPLSGEVTLGRSGENAIHLDDDQASRRHARISQQGGGWVLEDLDSRNGTFVNGQRIARAVLLQEGDQVQIGSSLFQVATPGRVEAVIAESACPHCGHPVSRGARFCRYCGQTLP